MQTIARSVGRSPSAASSAAIVSRLTFGSFVWPAASVVFWWQKTNVSPASSRSRASATRPRRSPTGSSVSGASTASSPSAVPRPRRKAESAANAPATPWRSRKLGTCRGRPNHLSVITLKRSPSSRPHHLARPRLARRRRALGLGHERLRPQQRMPRAEEGVGVGDPLVGAAGDPQHGLAAPDVGQREGQAVDLDPVAALDQLLGQLRRRGPGRAGRSATSRPRAARRAAAPRRRRRARRSPPGRGRAPRRPRARGTRRAGSRASTSARPRSKARARGRRRRAARSTHAPRARRGSASPRLRSRCARRAPRAPGRRARRAGRRRSDTRRGG